MNIFRMLGDMAHLASFLVMVLRLQASRSAQGISLKSQELFLLTYVTRYLDLFTNFVSVYNTVMKLLYLSLSGAIVYFIRMKEPFRSSYDKSLDSFLHWKFAVLPCAILAIIFNERFEVMEILWTFSIYLEAVAIIPQLILLQRHGEVENLTSNYVVLLGMYRAFYLINWIYRAATESAYHTIWLMFIAGIVQTALYVDFFYYYVIRYASCSRFYSYIKHGRVFVANTTARKCRSHTNVNKIFSLSLSLFSSRHTCPHAILVRRHVFVSTIPCTS
jgi:ER lumen protein retaining receptor